MCYIEDMKEIVTSWADFERLIKAKVLVYVDKTAYVHRLVRDYGGFYFISRPRRFGKSLMCSTLDALFSGKKELFEGLRIARTDYSFKAYPVLRFDFSKLDTGTYEDFLNGFRRQLRANAVRCGLTLNDMKPADMMDELLSALASPVIIIDEFDSPVIDAVSRGEKELSECMRFAFNSFYKVIKSHAGRIRFLFITGCTKLSGLAIFSAMNNLVDISSDPEYSSAFGYTEEELEENFSEHIYKKLSEPECGYGSREELLAAMRNYYDGYRFSPRSAVSVYNPVSVGRYFSDSGTMFENYWIHTGGANTLAVTLARNIDLISIVEDRPCLTTEDLALFDISDMAEAGMTASSALSLLYYAGYLTISGVKGRTLELDFPDAEVRTSFLSGLVKTYTRRRDSPGTLVDKVLSAAGDGDTGAIISCLNAYYRLFNYDDLRGGKERHIRNLFKAFFGMLDYAVWTELPAGKGRLDAVLVSDSHNYIFEFKVDGKVSTEAFEQIIARNYAWLLPENARPLHLIGLDFRTEEQQIVSYTHQLYGSGGIETCKLS